MKKLLLLLFISTISFAQNANRKFVSHQWKSNLLEIKTSDGFYRIQPYTDKIVETSFIPNSEIYNSKSHAVILTPTKGLFKLKETKNALLLSSNGITVTIEKSPFKISYSYNNATLLSEKNGYTKKDSTKILDFNLDPKELLYGGGERALGMNRRGNRLQLYNRASYGYETHAALMNFCIPLI